MATFEDVERSSSHATIQKLNATPVERVIGMLILDVEAQRTPDAIFASFNHALGLLQELVPENRVVAKVVKNCNDSLKEAKWREVNRCMSELQPHLAKGMRIVLPKTDPWPKKFKGKSLTLIVDGKTGTMYTAANGKPV